MDLSAKEKISLVSSPKDSDSKSGIIID